MEWENSSWIIQTQLLAGVSSPHGGAWRTMDNKNQIMTDAEVKIFILAAFAYISQLKQAAWTHKENLDTITDRELLKEYDITIGW